MTGLVPRAAVLVALVFGSAGCAEEAAAAAGPVRDRAEAAVDPATLALAREMVALERRAPKPPERKYDWRATRRRFASPAALAAEVTPISARIATRIEDVATGEELGEGVALQISRTADRILLRNRRAGAEWFFRRNPIDPAQMSATRVMHGHRLLLDYTQSDLRHEALPESFAKLALLNLDQETLAALRPDGRTESRFEREFACLVPAEPADGVHFEVWWNTELAVPLRIVREQDGKRLVQELLALRAEVDENRLRDPGERLRIYRRQDLVDWREELCNCGKDHTAQLSRLPRWR